MLYTYIFAAVAHSFIVECSLFFVQAVKVQCYGEGPVVNVEPSVLDFGAIEVLQNVPRHVNISNESLIPATFTVRLVRPRSVFTVEPTSGQIAPLGRSTLVVTANLDDSLQCALVFSSHSSVLYSIHLMYCKHFQYNRKICKLRNIFK